MKKLLFTFLLILASALITFGQKNTPEAVKKAFNQKFADAKSVKWSGDSENEWEAEFIFNGREMSSSYDNTGKWLETETEVALKEIPAAVTATLNKEFAGYKKGEASFLESPELKGYEIALKKAGSSIEIVIDANGKILQNKIVQEDDEKTEKE